MPKITMKVNIKATMAAFQHVRGQPPIIASKNIGGTLKRVMKQMQSYPPQRSGSRYVRTYKFKNAWKLIEQARGWKLENTATKKRGGRYGNYVVGDALGEGQAWMHVGRWLLFRDVVDYEMTKLTDAVEANLKLVIRQNGLS